MFFGQAVQRNWVFDKLLNILGPDIILVSTNRAYIKDNFRNADGILCSSKNCTTIKINHTCLNGKACQRVFSGWELSKGVLIAVPASPQPWWNPGQGKEVSFFTKDSTCSKTADCHSSKENDCAVEWVIIIGLNYYPPTTTSPCSSWYPQTMPDRSVWKGETLSVVDIVHSRQSFLHLPIKLSPEGLRNPIFRKSHCSRIYLRIKSE